MEDALAQMNTTTTQLYLSMVLILVLMEDALARVEHDAVKAGAVKS